MYHPVLHSAMVATVRSGTRTFKSAWFAKAARKARISDRELCEAVAQAMAGLADDLGGGVFKKRLNDNMHRSIILARGGRHWVFQYLFAKQDRANIADDELRAFRLLAKSYAALSDAQIGRLIGDHDFTEICHDRAD